MASTLAQLQTRISQYLSDVSNATFTVLSINEGLRAALEEYDQHQPYQYDTVVTCSVAGREINLSSLTGLTGVSDVWFPYDSLTEVWPPTKAPFKIVWDDAQPVLFLNLLDDSIQPQIGDEVRVWYRKPHTVQNLDSATVTTIYPGHEGPIVRGAAGFAALIRQVDRSGEFNLEPATPNQFEAWATIQVGLYRAWLRGLQQTDRSTVEAMPQKGWKLDKWDV